MISEYLCDEGGAGNSSGAMVNKAKHRTEPALRCYRQLGTLEDGRYLIYETHCHYKDAHRSGQAAATGCMSKVCIVGSLTVSVAQVVTR
jgi:hypothetical protein